MSNVRYWKDYFFKARKKSERENRSEDVPTPSTLPRIKACNGSFQACKGLPNGDSLEALKGTACHLYLADWLANKDLIIEGCPYDIFNVIFVIKSWVEELENNGWEIFLIEEKITVGIFSGTADLIMRRNKGDEYEYLVVDHKSGYKDVDINSEQMIGYAYLAMNYLNVDKIGTSVFQPKSKEDYELVGFSLHEATETTGELLALGMSKESNRTVGTGCDYCPAIFTDRCPESTKEMSNFMQKSKDKIDFKNINREEIKRMIIFSELFGKSAIKKVDQLKEGVYQSGDDLDGVLMSVKGSTRRVIYKDAGALQEIQKVLDPSEIDKIVTISSSALKKVLSEKKGKTFADDYVDEIIETFGEVKQNKDSIKLTKEAKFDPYYIENK